MLAQDGTGSPAIRRESMVAFLAALCIFGTGVTTLVAHVTDISAMRVLHGDVPYRDFWTMYAPGSFVTLAVAFAAFGPHLVISNALGILAASGALAVFYGLVRRETTRGVAVAFSLVVAAAFYGTGYSTGFTSYPPAILLVVLAVSSAASRVENAGASVVVPGLLLGTAAIFKHDIAAYATLSTMAGLLVAHRMDREGARRALRLGAVAVVPPALAAAVLVALGAGAGLWNDLVRFPLVDFRYVRREYFPLVPRFSSAPIDNIQELVHWSKCNLPSVALVAGGVLWARRRTALSIRASFLASMASAGFVLHWWAAHVQINTNAISLPIWALIATATLAGARLAPGTPIRRAMAVIILAGWAAVYPARLVYDTYQAGATEWVQLPKLEGIRGPATRVAEFRSLAAAMAEAGSPEAPLLLLGRRNDAVIYAELFPFWLTDRVPATAFHELHPGITDTEAGQRRMLAEIARGPWPVVVREHRFDDIRLERFKASVTPFVPIGSPLIDAWVAEHYVSVRRIGAYEILRRAERP